MPGHYSSLPKQDAKGRPDQAPCLENTITMLGWKWDQAMSKRCPSRPPLPLILLSSSILLLHLHRWASNPREVQVEEILSKGDLDHFSHANRTIPLQHCPCTRWTVLQKMVSNICTGRFPRGIKSTWIKNYWKAPAPGTLLLEAAVKRLLLSPSTVPPTQPSTRRRSTGAGSRRT